MAQRLFLLMASALVYTGLTRRTALAALTEFPKDTVALLHFGATLKCSTDLSIPIDWYFYPSTAPNEKYPIYLNTALTRDVTHKYKVERSASGTYALVMESVDWSHAGTYICYDDAGIGVNASAKLTVLDPSPSWNIGSSEVDGFPAPCSSWDFQFSYVGSQTPYLQLETRSKSQFRNVTKSVGPRTTEQRPSKAKFVNLTMDLCERSNDTNYYRVCVWKTIQSPEAFEDGFVTHTISLHQSTTIVALKCKRHSIDDNIRPLNYETQQHLSVSLWQPTLITAAVLLTVIASLILYIGCLRRKQNHTNAKTANVTTAPVDVNTSSTVIVTEFHPEPPYENITDDNGPSALLFSESTKTSAMRSKSQWNPVYVEMSKQRNARLGSMPINVSRRTPADHGTSEDRTPMGKLNRRGDSRRPEYLEVIP